MIFSTSGADRDRFSVLTPTQPIIGPTDNLPEVKSNVTLPCEDPVAGQPFVVLLEPIPSGGIGRAVVSGVTQVQVYVTDVDHEYAEAVTGVPGYLKSAVTGGARILWKEAGTGLKWATIRLLVLVLARRLERLTTAEQQKLTSADRQYLASAGLTSSKPVADIRAAGPVPRPVTRIG